MRRTQRKQTKTGRGRKPVARGESSKGGKGGPSREHMPGQTAARGKQVRPRPHPRSHHEDKTQVEHVLPAAAVARLQEADARLRERTPLRVGQWLWTMREGAERDVVEELLLKGDLRPHGVVPSLVASDGAPTDENSRPDVTFARQGFPIAALARGMSAQAIADALVPTLVTAVGDTASYGLHVFVPDSTAANALAQRAQAVEAELATRLLGALPDRARVQDFELRRSSVPVLQVCLYKEDKVAAGALPADRCLSTAAGGRGRMRLHSAAPSRAARKLEEAFAWLGVSPGPGELCVDLGAAPGGWSWLLLERRARVIAVDRARMDKHLSENGRLRHVRGNAFEFAPEETVDWLFCDMAWRPLEVARMLARWARKRYTRFLVANFKLPMKRKAEMVEQLRGTLAAGGFSNIRTRQLYHDREEITLTAYVR
jgi:23S rRNA (cytidine2498-2'-O)-methyltransferase